MRRRCCWSPAGAGFIGSNVVASLNEAGRTDIAVNDILSTGQKWRNLVGRRLAEFEPAGDLLRWLEGRKLDAVVHMGAISSTTENNVDLLAENNFRMSPRLRLVVHSACAAQVAQPFRLEEAPVRSGGDRAHCTVCLGTNRSASSKSNALRPVPVLLSESGRRDRDTGARNVSLHPRGSRSRR